MTAHQQLDALIKESNSIEISTLRGSNWTPNGIIYTVVFAVATWWGGPFVGCCAVGLWILSNA